MPVFQHVRELHVAEAADGGIADVGTERAARVSVLEQVGYGVADVHFVPHADAHGRAFLGIHGIAAEIFLVQPEIQHMAFAQEGHERRLDAQLDDEQVQAWLVNHGHDFAEEHIHLALPFLHDGVEAEEPNDGEEQRHEHEHGGKHHHGGNDEMNQRGIGKIIIHGYPPQSRLWLH